MSAHKVTYVLKTYSCNGRAARTTRTRQASHPHPNQMPPIVNQCRWVVSHDQLAVSWPFLGRFSVVFSRFSAMTTRLGRELRNSRLGWAERAV
jgi:hypothetical protein